MPFQKGNTYWKQHVGKKLSSDHIEKLKKAHTGKKLTKEHAENISKSLKGRIITWNKKLSESAKGNKNADKGEEHVNWKGDDVGYGAIHSWVRRWKGKPSCCEVCGTKHTKRYEWANIDHQYRRVLEDYISMCVKCHKRYDRDNN